MAQNMAYCRFQNTYLALKECLQVMEEDEEEMSDLSTHEQRYKAQLIALCALVSEYEDDDPYHLAHE